MNKFTVICATPTSGEACEADLLNEELERLQEQEATIHDRIAEIYDRLAEIASEAEEIEVQPESFEEKIEDVLRRLKDIERKIDPYIPHIPTTYIEPQPYVYPWPPTAEPYRKWPGQTEIWCYNNVC